VHSDCCPLEINGGQCPPYFADNLANKLGTDRFGNTWSATNLPDGKQVWVALPSAG
jgi:hypothetical protein